MGEPENIHIGTLFKGKGGAITWCAGTIGISKDCPGQAVVILLRDMRGKEQGIQPGPGGLWQLLLGIAVRADGGQEPPCPGGGFQVSRAWPGEQLFGII